MYELLTATEYKDIPKTNHAVIVVTDNVMINMNDIFMDLLTRYDDDGPLWEALTEYLFFKYIRKMLPASQEGWERIVHDILDIYTGSVTYLDVFKAGLVAFDNEVGPVIKELLLYTEKQGLVVSLLYPTGVEMHRHTFVIIAECIPKYHHRAPSLTAQGYL